MNQGRPYYRSRRLVELASLGLRLEQHGFAQVSSAKQTLQTVQVPNSIPPSVTNNQTLINEEPVQKKTHYTIPDDPEMLNEILQSLNFNK